MVVIVGLVVLFVAVIVGTVGVLGNAGAAHPLAENFSVLGYHVTGSTGTLFLSGVVVGAVGMLGLSVLLAAMPDVSLHVLSARRHLRTVTAPNYLNSNPARTPVRRWIRKQLVPPGKGFPCSVAGRVAGKRSTTRPST
jgi:hypothetical protein